MLMAKDGLSAAQLSRLRQYDTCTLSNAIERLRIRPRCEGFVTGTAECRFPHLQPVIGYAVTGKVRAAMPPIDGRGYYEDLDWWRYLVTVPAPRIVVMQDTDPSPGVGALFGEVHARICRALGCVAYVTNGAVRDLPGIEALDFQLFAGSVVVSHAYAHVVAYGEPVEIGGLGISSGDLLHGDLHGVHSIPRKGIHRLSELAEQIRREEHELFQLTESKGFSVDMLAAKLGERAGKR